MARIRSVKPETWDDRKLARVSRDARLLYVALWNFADEWSRMHGDPRLIKGKVFPYDDDVDTAVVTKWLDELAAHDIRAIVRYEHDGDPYLFLPKLIRHQYLDPVGTPSRLPEPPDFDEDRYLAEPGAKKRTNASMARDSRRSRHHSEETPNQSGENPDYSGDAPDESVHSRLQGAGSREQVAGSRDRTARRAVSEPDDGDSTASAQTLVGEWIDNCRERPPARIIGHVSKELKILLDEGIPYDRVRRGLADWHRAGQHPSTLASFVNAAMNASPGGGRLSRQEIDQRGTDEMFDRAMTRAQEREAKAALTAGGEPS